LHLRLSAETQGYLGKERLALMKPTAFLINTARGGLVDKQALIDALRDKRPAGAALDVFHEEPIPPGDALLALPELVLTPQQRWHDPGGDRQQRAAGGGEHPALPHWAAAGCGGGAAGAVTGRGAGRPPHPRTRSCSVGLSDSVASFRNSQGAAG
jgi:hypothetical protein